jgi:hypothetical protein
MAANATTWFYKEPETGRPYLIAERVNHTFWTNRITDVYFTCVSAERPYRLTGVWNSINLELEFEPNAVFIMRMSDEHTRFVKGVAELLGFPPTVSYTDADQRHIIEWYAKDAGKRLQEVQGNPSFQNVKLYKR